MGGAQRKTPQKVRLGKSFGMMGCSPPFLREARVWSGASRHLTCSARLLDADWTVRWRLLVFFGTAESDGTFGRLVKMWRMLGAFGGRGFCARRASVWMFWQEALVDVVSFPRATGVIVLTSVRLGQKCLPSEHDHEGCGNEPGATESGPWLPVGRSSETIRGPLDWNDS